MKTIKHTSKSILLASSFVLFSSINSFSQDGIIWTKTQNFNELGIYYENDKVFSKNESIQTLINDYSINKIDRAVASSRKRSLQNLVEITCECEESDLLAAVSKLSDVFHAPEIGPHYKTLDVPNDYNAEFTEDYALDLINAQSAWDVTHGDSSIIIAISDQNFQVTHIELMGKIHHYDESNTAAKPHGTAVAITAAGNTNNGLGKSSIGYNSELALYRMSYNDLLTATYSGYRVINVSWTSGCVQSDYIQDVIDEVYENGSIIVSSAGNGSTCGGASNLVFPAACEKVISVTGVGPNDNHEKVPGDSLSTFQHNTTVDISAPGYDVPLSTLQGYYITGNGTSFSAPFVSGTIALMLSVDSCLTFEDVEHILYSTAVDIDNLNPEYAGLIGAGRLDAGAAVQMASTYMSCTGGVVNEPNPPSPNPNENPNKELFTFDIEAQSTAGIDEVESIELKIFPNPVLEGNTVNIISSNNIEKCDITNVNGKIIQTISPMSNEFKVSDLAQGTYFINILFDNGITKIKQLIVF